MLCLGTTHLILTMTLGGEDSSYCLDKETKAQGSHGREQESQSSTQVCLSLKLKMVTTEPCCL